ncbi:hypothetical protein LY78DRAFT_276785 [Colletotrichum sublineola]|nr:hypothetical protein LY78DRAFT_276785 [Colletotrichum sublineola]
MICTRQPRQRETFHPCHNALAQIPFPFCEAVGTCLGQPLDGVWVGSAREARGIPTILSSFAQRPKHSCEAGRNACLMPATRCVARCRKTIDSSRLSSPRSSRSVGASVGPSIHKTTTLCRHTYTTKCEVYLRPSTLRLIRWAEVAHGRQGRRGKRTSNGKFRTHAPGRHQQQKRNKSMCCIPLHHAPRTTQHTRRRRRRRRRRQTQATSHALRGRLCNTLDLTAPFRCPSPRPAFTAKVDNSAKMKRGPPVEWKSGGSLLQGASSFFSARGLRLGSLLFGHSVSCHKAKTFAQEISHTSTHHPSWPSVLKENLPSVFSGASPCGRLDLLAITNFSIQDPGLP